MVQNGAEWCQMVGNGEELLGPPKPLPSILLSPLPPLPPPPPQFLVYVIVNILRPKTHSNKQEGSSKV